MCWNLAPPPGRLTMFLLEKDGSIRVASDFRALNDATVTDSYPMQDTRQGLDWWGSKRVLSTFDVKDAFYQVELEDRSNPLTAIRIVVGLLQYTRLPQGMKNSPVTLQRIIYNVLGDGKGQDVFAFMEDTSVGIETEEQNLPSLESLLGTLLHAGIRLKLSKCRFGVRSTEILGHHIYGKGLHLPSPYGSYWSPRGTGIRKRIDEILRVGQLFLRLH